MNWLGCLPGTSRASENPPTHSCGDSSIFHSSSLVFLSSCARHAIGLLTGRRGRGAAQGDARNAELAMPPALSCCIAVVMAGEIAGTTHKKPGKYGATHLRVVNDHWSCRSANQLSSELSNLSVPAVQRTQVCYKSYWLSS